MLREVELIDQSAQNVRVNPSARCDEACPNFNDDSHGCRLELPATDWIWNLPLLFLYRNFALEKAGEFGGRDNSSILPLEWLSGKPKNLAALGLMPASNATSRFSDRVENYVRYRPGYPSQVVETLKAECGLKPEHIIADIASGTGIWTRVQNPFYDGLGSWSRSWSAQCLLVKRKLRESVANRQLSLEDDA